MLEGERAGLSPKKATKIIDGTMRAKRTKIFLMGVIKNRLLKGIQGVQNYLLVFAVCQVPNGFWEQEVFNLPQKNRDKLVLEIEPQGLDNYRREKLAELLTEIKEQTSEIRHKLYVDLAETKAARDISYSEASQEDKLARGRILSQYNRNEEVVQLFPDAFNCESSYLRSLAYRRLRQYDNATSSLKESIKLCEGTLKKKARFLEARIKAMKTSEESIQFLDAFIQNYPGDRYTDDVLLWKAHVLEELGETKKAALVLELILKEYPHGDMYHKALFERALQTAIAGNLDQSLNYLNRLHTVQGLYWHGRLMMYPDPRAFKENHHQKQF